MEGSLSLPDTPAGGGLWPDASDGASALLTRRKLWVGGAAVFAGIGYLTWSALRGGTVYYLTVAELRSRPLADLRRGVRVAGHVVPGTIVRTADGGPLLFAVTDGGAGGLDRLPVSYKGIVPDVFGEDIEVVVEGRYTGERFEATMLLAKCPSRFEGATDKL